MNDQRKTKVQLIAELAALRQRVAELEAHAASDSAERLRHVLENSPDAAYRRNLSTDHYDYLSAAITNLSGFTPDEFMNMPIERVLERTHPDDVARVSQTLRAALTSNAETCELEYRFKRRTGDYSCFSDRFHIIRDAQGRPTFLVGSVRDVTENKRAQEALRQREEQFRTVADFTSDWEYWIAPDRQFIYISPSCERISGYRPEEFIADPSLIDRIVHLADRAAFDEHVQRYHAQKTLNPAKGEIEFRIVHKNGEVHWVGHVCTPVVDAQQHFLGRRVSNRDMTERHRIEAALRESEERHRLLVNLSPDAIYLHQNGRFVFANAAGVQLLGATSTAELIGRPILDVIHPDYREAVTRRVQAALQSGQPTPLLEEKYIRLDGRVIDVEVIAARLIYQGVPTVQVIARDITARRQAKEALRQSEASLRAIFESSPLSFAFLDRQMIFRAFNRAASLRTQVMFGREMQIGESTLDYTEPDTIEAFKRNFQRALNGERVSSERRMLGQDGTDWWLELHYAPVRDAEEQIIGVLLSTIDITERRRAEEALRESEEKTRNLFSTDLVAIYIFEADTQRLLDVNEAFVRLHGWSREELLTMHAYDISAEPQRVEAARREAATAHSMHIPLRYHQKKDGTIFPIELFSGPFSWKGRNVRYGMIIDISERQRAAAELERLYNQLQADADTQAQLLREVNHRVKNNLISILGLLLIERRYAPAEGRAYMNAVLDNTARRVTGLLAVHQMLSESHWAPIRLSALVERLITTEIHALPKRRAAIAAIQPSLIEVSPRQASNLALVINELTTNTLKHALKDQDLVQISVRCDLDAQFIQLEYRDDGPGYPPEVLNGEYRSVGLHLVKQLVTETLRGALILSNDGGAVALVRLKVEETERT